MKAAWYEKQGPAREVLLIGEIKTPWPGEGEVRIRLAASGINPGDVRKRQDAFGVGMPYRRIVPHSDGAGTIDAVGASVSPARIGERAWCYGAQTYRPGSTAAEYTVVPSHQAIPLSDDVSFEQGACLGIPGITAHRAVHVAGHLAGKTVLVQGGSGAVGLCAVRLARQAGATVIATCRTERDIEVASVSGAHHVLLISDTLIPQIRAISPDGIDHIVEVAFGENIGADMELLAQGGSIAAYASHTAMPEIPFWPLLFKNATIHLVGSDDISRDNKVEAANALTAALEDGWQGLPIAERYPLEEIAVAHESVQQGSSKGRVILIL